MAANRASSTGGSGRVLLATCMLVNVSTTTDCSLAVQVLNIDVLDVFQEQLWRDQQARLLYFPWL